MATGKLQPVWPKGFHTITDAAKKLGVTRQRVYQILDASGITPTMYGTTRLLSDDDIKAIRALPKQKPGPRPREET